MVVLRTSVNKPWPRGRPRPKYWRPLKGVTSSSLMFEPTFRSKPALKSIPGQVGIFISGLKRL